MYNSTRRTSWHSLLLGVLIVLALATPASGQGVGIFSRTDCSTLTSPISGLTICWDSTATKWRYYDGTRYISDVSGATRIINVRDYGATGDGVTNDATSIQNAINALTSGGVVYIPRGNYVIGAQLTLGASDIAIVGDGGRNSRLTFSAAGAVTRAIYATGRSRIRVEGLYIIGAGGPLSSTTDFGISLATCNYCIVRNNIVENTAATAIAVSGASATSFGVGNQIVGNIVISGFSDGISGQFNRAAIVAGNYLESVGSATDRYAINFEGFDHGAITGNTVSAGTNGILLNNGQTALPSDSAITGNVVRATSGPGIFVQAKRVTVTGNVSSGNTIGIYLSDQNYSAGNCGARHSGHTVDGNDVRQSVRAGIAVETNGNIISGNLIMDSNTGNSAADDRRTGIVLGASACNVANGASNNVVVGNLIVNTINNESAEANGLQRWGVRVDVAAAADNFIYQNKGINLVTGGADVSNAGTRTRDTTSPFWVVGGAGNATANRQGISLQADGFAGPGAFNTNSNGDKFVYYSNGTDYDARCGIGTSANRWCKSITNTGGGSFEWYTSSTSSAALVVNPGGSLSPISFTFANIGTVLTANGQIGYCSDCTIANPCAGGGTGAIAKRLNATNVCN